MTGRQSETAQLKQTILDLQTRLEDLRSRLPAHSIPAAMVAEFDALDESLADAQNRLALLLSQNPQGSGESPPKD